MLHDNSMKDSKFHGEISWMPPQVNACSLGLANFQKEAPYKDMKQRRLQYSRTGDSLYALFTPILESEMERSHACQGICSKIMSKS